MGRRLLRQIGVPGIDEMCQDTAKMPYIQPIPVEASLAVPVVRRCLGDALVGIYLHGSAVAGGLRRHSDVDLMAVIDRPMTRAARACLVAALLKISAHPDDNDGRRPLELIVFSTADLEAPLYPARSEFVYGEWLRRAFEAEELPDSAPDPEFTLVLAQARQEALHLVGPDPAGLLPAVPDNDVARAIQDALPALVETLHGDERNVLLTLARMWRTAAMADFVAKDVAAQWAFSRLPAEAAEVLGRARLEYLGAVDVDWPHCRLQVERTAALLRQRVMRCLTQRLRSAD